jgi:hypothetical protein
MSETKNAVDLVEPEMRILMQFITSNRDKLSEIYDMEHQTRGVDNPNNQGNPGCLVVTRKPDNTVDIYYYEWSAMETTLQKEVLVGKNENNLIHMVLIDKVTNKSIMVGVEKMVESGESTDNNTLSPALE